MRTHHNNLAPICNRLITTAATPTNTFKLISLGLLLTLTTTVTLLTFLNSPAEAAPSIAPESCFEYNLDTPNAGEVTITDYYDNEGDGPSNSACTRELIIPNTLGGQSVARISGAFEYKRLLSVVIPDSIVDISKGSFDGNRLTTVVVEGFIDDFGGDDLGFDSSPISTLTYNGTTYTDLEPNLESCYRFDVGTGTIDAFLSAEIPHINDNPGIPGAACLNRNIIIPDSINGQDVDAIGRNAFSESYITSVSLSNLVSYIEEGAFSNNNLTSLIIPNSVATIEHLAFSGNNIASVVIPSSVTSLSPTAFVGQTIPGGTTTTDVNDSNVDPQVVQSYFDGIIYLCIYADDPSPLGLVDMVLTEADIWGEDMNGNGHQNDIASAQIINPAHITITHEDGHGNEIAPPTVFTGDGLSSYLAVDNPTNDLGLYYRSGDNATVSPLSISGYDSPSSQTISNLDVGENNISFVYTSTTNDNNNNSNNNSNDSSSNSNTNTDNTNTPNNNQTLSNTGINTTTIAILASTIIAIATATTIILIRKNKGRIVYRG